MELDLTENYFKVPTHANRRMDETTGNCLVNVIKIGDSLVSGGITFDNVKKMIGSVHLDLDYSDLMTLPGGTDYIKTYTKLYETFNVPLTPKTKPSDFEIVLLIEGYYGMTYLVTGMMPTGLNNSQGVVMIFRAKSIISNAGVDTFAIKLAKEREDAIRKKDLKDAIIFYYGQTSVRNSTASRMEELEAEVTRADLDGKVSINKMFMKATSKVLAIRKKMKDRLEDKKDFMAKYTYESMLQKERKAVTYDMDSSEKIKNDIVMKVDAAKVVIIHIPKYISHAWVSVATYALFHKDKKIVYFTGDLEKIRHTGSLIYTNDYLQAEEVGDVFTRSVYDKKGEIGSNIVTKILNKEI